MDRRSFLGLLGGAAAAAVYVPKRSFFFGPWLPTPRDAELVTVTEEWTPERTRWLFEQVDHGTLSHAQIWDRELRGHTALWGTDHGVYLARREADALTIRRIKRTGELVGPVAWRDGELVGAWRDGELVRVDGTIETRSFALRDELMLAFARQ